MKVLTVLSFLGGLSELVYGCVFITVSSLPERMLELNWNCHDSIDTVSLYSKDPARNESKTPDTSSSAFSFDMSIFFFKFSGLKPLAEVSVLEKSVKYHTTDIKFEPEPFPGSWSYEDEGEKEAKGGCLYWITASYQGQQVHSNCLSIQPAWMSEHK